MNNIASKTLVFGLLILTALPALATGPRESAPARLETDRPSPSRTALKYTDGFSVTYGENYKVLTVSSPWPGSQTTFRYLLVHRGTPVPPGYANARVIEVPVRSVVTMSTSYLPYLEKLGLTNALVGHDSLQYVYSPAIRSRIDEGRISEVGSGSLVNVELLLEMEPDLILTYGIGNEWDAHPKLLEAGLPVAINGEWAETSPLGRTEWIKFIALFFDKEEEAERIFSSIETEYLALVRLAANAAEKPAVFVNSPYQGTWWMSGGGSFAAALLRDSGAEYLWSGEESTGGIPLDFETVFERALKADFWLNPGTWNSLADGTAADKRFAEFGAFKSGAVYNNNARASELGGIDYFESGPANPHVVLADLVRIFHPELVPDHELFYYRRLE